MAVFFTLCPDTAQGDEAALPKLSQCESVGCPLPLHVHPKRPHAACGTGSLQGVRAR